MSAIVLSCDRLPIFFPQLRAFCHRLNPQLCLLHAWFPACACCGGLIQTGIKFYISKPSKCYVQHLEPGTEPFTPEQEFGEMTLSDYDSDEDADYAPSDSEGSSDDLEYDSGASVSSASEDESGDVSATE